MGYVKTYRNSKNLFNKQNADIYEATNVDSELAKWNKYTGTGKTIRIAVSPSTTYSISIESNIETTVFRVLLVATNATPEIGTPVMGSTAVASSTDNTGTFTTAADTQYIVMQFTAAVFDDCVNSLMLVNDSVPYNYEAYGVTAWYDFCKKKTADGWTDSTAQKAPF